MFMKTLAFLAAMLGSDEGRSAPPAQPAPVRVAQATAAPARTASAVVDRVQAFYRDTQQLSAVFRQTTRNETFGKTSTSDGRVYLKKPGKMRWDYYSKRNKNEVTKSQMSDGDTLWVVDMKGKWYYRQNLADSALPVAVTFLTGKGNLKSDFNAKMATSKKYGGKNDIVLELTPKKPSAQFKQLFLVVDPGNYRVKQSIVINAAGDVNQFAFYEPNTKKAVADTTFVFNPKSSAARGFREIKPEQAPKQ